MQAPQTIDVLDRHQGFTAIIPYRRSSYARGYNTLWRPGKLLKRGTTGNLQESDEHSFFQLNDDVTMAIYKVPGYPYRVAVWFDNKTGERIA